MYKLIDAIQYLQNKYKLFFTIKDFFGYIFSSPSGEQLKKLYNSHYNGYCMYIKKIPEAHQHCVETSYFRLYQKILCLENPTEGFFGTCWCGVREYVIPIQYHGNYIGAIIVGPFSCEAGRAKSSFERVSKIYGFNKDQLSYNYSKYIAAHTEIDTDALVLVRLCAAYLNEILDNCDELPSYNTYKRQHTIINSSLNYIRHLDLSQKATISDIARHCGCSESTLSHLFNKTFDIGVAKYIYNMRIAKAKKALAKTDKSIASIAEACGFCSAAHFSNSFKKSTGLTALDYRNS